MNNNYRNNNEGEITIKHASDKRNKGFAEGEYIEYEDINENKLKN